MFSRIRYVTGKHENEKTCVGDIKAIYVTGIYRLVGRIFIIKHYRFPLRNGACPESNLGISRIRKSHPHIKYTIVSDSET